MLISSDTNIWIDFFDIGHPDHPFLLEDQYYLSSAAYDDELIPRDEKRTSLLGYGLHVTDLSEAELKLAIEYAIQYKRLSSYDTFALAIAKIRSWALLTGDKPLRNAATNENVECHGLIWIYDEIHRLKKLNKEKYREVLRELIAYAQEGKIRLPIDELEQRLKMLDEE